MNLDLQLPSGINSCFIAVAESFQRWHRIPSWGQASFVDDEQDAGQTVTDVAEATNSREPVRQTCFTP